MEVYASDNGAVPTGTKNTFTCPLEVETDDDAGFSVEVSATSRAG